MIPEPTSANCAVIIKGTNEARNREAADSGNNNQHRINIGPVPIWIIFRLILLEIIFLLAIKSIERIQMSAMINVSKVASHMFIYDLCLRASLSASRLAIACLLS